MIGPGVATDEMVAECLLYRELNRHRGRSPVVLIPVECRELVRAAYAWGGRNIEFHVAQSLGPAHAPKGVTFPTFLPESG